jgi:two-component system response regulator QseB
VRKLLIVEDNLLVGRALGLLLQKVVAVSVATTLAEGMARMGDARWAAVIVDLSLPDGNGLDFLAHARSEGYEGPALVYSAYYTPEEINRAYALDARYLVKPASAEDIRAFVHAALDDTSPIPMQRWIKRYKLTPAEAAILRAAAMGASRKQIAARRRRSLLTMKTQIRALLGKTGDASLLGAVARLLRERA